MFGWLRRRSAPNRKDVAPPSPSEDSQEHLGNAGLAWLDKLEEGRLLRQAGRHAEALAVFDEILGLSESPAEVHLEVALTYLSTMDLLAAVDSLQVAVTLDPCRGDAWSLLGSTLSRLDREPEAIEALRTALLYLPSDQILEARLKLANSLHAAKRRAEAEVEVRVAIVESPAEWRLYALLGNLLVAREQEDQALLAYAEAKRLCPSPPIELLLQLGWCFQQSGQFRQAQQQFEGVLESSPNHPIARWFLAQCDLVLGQWERGWKHYGVRFAAGASAYRALPYPVWDGSLRPQSTLLVLADQGLGDEIMFASCLVDASQRVGHCIVECEPRLRALFERSFPQATVITSQRETNASWLKGVARPDFQIFAGDLPALLRPDDASFGSGQRYLYADPARVDYWNDKLRGDLGESVRVGISWRGGTPGTRSRSRSVRAEDWAPLMRVPGLRFVNLQYGDCAEDLSRFSTLFNTAITNYPEVIADYDDTAALVCALDVVVTVCTSIVHLTGALGRPVWILVPHSPGWRYTLGRESMPWYASSRMFRQPASLDWTEAVHQVVANLAQVTQNVSR